MRRVALARMGQMEVALARSGKHAMSQALESPNGERLQGYSRDPRVAPTRS